MSQNLIILQSLKDTAIMRQLSEYINNDFKPFSSSETVAEIQDFFADITYSHFPIMDNGIYLGCISAVDAETFETGKKISDFRYSYEGFFVRESMIWLDVLEVFARNNSNIVPILEQEQEEDMFRVQTKPKSVDTDKMGSKPEEKHIFEQGTAESLEPLPEETQEDADQNKTEYVESLRNTWIEKYLKTTQFRIHENEGGGDCFFAVVRDA
jgi:hypothetical protein